MNPVQPKPICVIHFDPPPPAVFRIEIVDNPLFANDPVENRYFPGCNKRKNPHVERIKAPKMPKCAKNLFNTLMNEKT